MISRETIELIKEKIDILQLCDKLELEVTRTGQNYVTLCPFHDERTPSFTLFPETNTYKCFGCHVNGDAIELVKELQNLTFKESLVWLAELTKVEIQESDKKDAQPSTAPLLEIVAYAQELYQNSRHSAVTAFCAEKELDEEYLRKEWGVGYSEPNALLNSIKGKFKTSDVIAAGLLKEGNHGKPFEFFRGRMMWTIYDNLGRAVGFGARRLYDNDPVRGKFVNTSQTPLYKKSDLLFGLNKSRAHIRQDRIAILTEGYTDVVSYHLAGLPYSVSPCGTAFTEQQMKRIARLLAEDGELVVTMDGDDAGVNSAVKILDVASKYPIKLSAFILPDKMDPDEYRRAHGLESLKDQFTNRIPLVEALMKHVLDQHDLNHPEGVSQATQQCTEVLKNVHNPVLRQQYSKWLSYRVKAQPKDIESLYEPTPIKQKRVSAHSHGLELDVLRIAYQKPQVFQQFQEGICSRSDYFSDPEIQAVLDELLWFDAEMPDGQWREEFLKLIPERFHGDVKTGLTDGVIDSDNIATTYMHQLVHRLESDKNELKTQYNLQREVFASTDNAAEILNRLATRQGVANASGN